MAWSDNKLDLEKKNMIYETLQYRIYCFSHLPRALHLDPHGRYIQIYNMSPTENWLINHHIIFNKTRIMEPKMYHKIIRRIIL